MKKLNELEEKQMSNPQLRKSGLLPAVCHNPALPLDLQPVCASQEAASTFKALSKDIHPQIFLLLSLHPPLPLHPQLFLLSNPVAVDGDLEGHSPCPPQICPSLGTLIQITKNSTVLRSSSKTSQVGREGLWEETDMIPGDTRI